MGHQVTIFGGWVTMLQNKLQEDFPDEYQVLNKGIGGDTAQGVFNRLHRDVISLQPSIVMVAIGTNDAYGFAGVNTPARNSVDYQVIMDKIFNDLTQNLPDTSVFIMGMTTPLKKYIDIAGLGWAVPFQQEFLDTQFEEYNSVLKDLAQQYGYVYVDIRSKWPKDIEGSWAFYADGIHPSDAGNDKMMEILYSALRSTVVHPTSVKSRYKLTTTWGMMKSR